MTFCHLQLRKLYENDSCVKYAVFSPDFNDQFSDENVADLVLNKKQKTHDFVPGAKWVSEKTLPPMFFSLPEKRRCELLENEYKGYGNGAWAMRIHSWISQLIQNGVFPEIYPE